jgi:carboxypeptidase Q
MLPVLNPAWDGVAHTAGTVYIACRALFMGGGRSFWEASMKVGRLSWGVAAMCSVLAAPAVAQDLDLALIERIRVEGLENSQIERLARHLTEVIGPRLTGSPGMKLANEWTAETLESFGLEGARVEAWGEFGRGWENLDYYGRILTPFRDVLHGQPMAWTGSTDGTVRGQALVVEAETVEDLEKYRGKMGNAFILYEDVQEVRPEFEHRDRRASLESLLEPAARPTARRASARPRDANGRRAFIERRRAQRALRAAMLDMAAEEGAGAILRVSNRGQGVVAGSSAGSRTVGDPEGLPYIALSQEQFNQIRRNVAAGIPVELEARVENRFVQDDSRSYNTVAEIPGSDMSDEYVMVGAHLDSWHMGAGATDNAAGSVIMMEAMRILTTLEVKPRRTIRIALWSGEEQGLLGSRAWVANNEDIHDKISAYLNVDNGTGRLRGIWNQGNDGAVEVFENLLWPFRDLGVVAVRRGNTGGTDHLAFDMVGIPGFNFIQDPIEYGINTHHTELDTFDHLVLADLRQAAVVVASTVYHLAMMDEMMPRKGAAESR